jgi:hypothetical protein
MHRAPAEEQISDREEGPTGQMYRSKYAGVSGSVLPSFFNLWTIDYGFAQAKKYAQKKI